MGAKTMAVQTFVPVMNPTKNSQKQNNKCPAKTANLN